MTAAERRTSAGAEEGREYVPPVETHLILSRYVNQNFKVQVMQPIRKRGETPRFPVVYASDGNFAFDVLKGISYSIQTYERDAPRFILVGIGYPSDSPLAGWMLRSRDFTFPGYPQFSTEPPPVEGVLVAEPGTREFYGAENFQRFIGDELIPFIDEKYDTIPGERTYFGHSAGGAFGLFTLFTKSELFNKYVVSSPALSYQGKSSAGIHYEGSDFVIQEARKFIASGKSLESIRVYISVAAEEEFEPAYTQFQFTSSFFRFAALMKAAAIPGLELTQEVFAGETHMTVWPVAFIHGVQAVFDTGVRRKVGTIAE